MEPYQKPDLEIIALDGIDAILTSGRACCAGSDPAYAIDTPAIP